MGRKSSIEALPDDIREKLDRLLLDPRVTLDAATQYVNGWLAARGPKGQEGVSRSAVGRYKQAFDDMTRDVAETDRLAALMLKELNITNQSNVAKATAETLRVMLMHFIPLLRKSMQADELSIKDLKDITTMLKDLAAGHDRLERAASENERRDAQIRREARLEAADQLAEELRQDGLSPELESSIRRILIGG